MRSARVRFSARWDEALAQARSRATECARVGSLCSAVSRAHIGREAVNASGGRSRIQACPSSHPTRHTSPHDGQRAAAPGGEPRRGTTATSPCQAVGRQLAGSDRRPVRPMHPPRVSSRSAAAVGASSGFCWEGVREVAQWRKLVAVSENMLGLCGLMCIMGGARGRGVSKGGFIRSGRAGRLVAGGRAGAMWRRGARRGAGARVQA